jgi:hypothetical protein
MAHDRTFTRYLCMLFIEAKTVPEEAHWWVAVATAYELQADFRYPAPVDRVNDHKIHRLKSNIYAALSFRCVLRSLKHNRRLNTLSLPNNL